MIHVEAGQSAAYQTRPARAGDDRFGELAARLGAQFAARSASHDRENTFVAENYELLREAGYLRLAVPTELGGLGASLRQTCYAQAELARHCGATALAVNMHLYLSLATAFRWRRGAPDAAGPLRRVATEGIVLMTSGASDGIYPSARAEKVEGGYRVTGHKSFCSQAPVANVFITTAAHEDAQTGPGIIQFSVPTNAPGFAVVDTWDALGMRGTGSDDVQLSGVKVNDAQIAGRRPWGQVDPILRASLVHFSPLVSAVYYGVAVGARDEAVRLVCRRRRGDGQPLVEDPIVQRQVGLIEHKLRTAWWSLLGALDELGDDYVPDECAVNLVQTAKRAMTDQAVEVVDLAMDVGGGGSYLRSSPLEQAYRDVRAAKFHPFSAEKALLYSGRLALGLPVDRVW
jgi:acyl-CoA dehydrogenase